MRGVKELRTRRINLKITEAEYTKMETLMRVYHYQSISRFWRDLLEGKPLVKTRRVTRLSDDKLIDAMNRLTGQITIIGRNYNQAVARMEGLSRQRRADGSPVVSDAVAAAFLGTLKSQTEKLRDEVAVCIDMVERLSRKMPDTEDTALKTE